jgi:hypothetical protein
MALFESREARFKRLLNGLKKAHLKVQRSITNLGTQIAKEEAKVVEAAKAGQKLQGRAAAERVHLLMRTRIEQQRRDNMLSMWILKAENATNDSAIAQILKGLATNMKVAESGLGEAIDKFGDTLDDISGTEDAWKEGEDVMRQKAGMSEEEGLPSIERILEEANARAAAERGSEAAKPSANRDIAESEEAAALLRRARSAAEDKH